MVYLISDGEMTKIGWSIEPSRRLRQLQTAHPKPLKIFGVWDVHKVAEKRLHSALFHLKSRCNGEWFNISPTAILPTVSLILRPYSK